MEKRGNETLFKMRVFIFTQIKTQGKI